jgi:hypothetical protein
MTPNIVNNISSNIASSNVLVTAGLITDCQLLNFGPELESLRCKISTLDPALAGDLATIKNEYIKVLNLRLELMNINNNIYRTLLDIRTREKDELVTRLDQYLCAVCLVNPRNCILEPCYHFASCESCIAKLLDDNCPICRTRCTFYVKTFNP